MVDLFKAQLVPEEVLVEIAVGGIPPGMCSIEGFPVTPFPVFDRMDERLAAGMRGAFVNLVDCDVRE